MSYNVFTDFHHAGLLQSLILLFEKRLGGKVYRPIGMEWAEKGYWHVFDHPATQAQYLGIGGATPDGTPPLNEIQQILGIEKGCGHSIENQICTDCYNSAYYLRKELIYNCHDIDSGYINKAITFDGFKRMKIDIVIASLPQHIEPYKKLCELHPNKPKLIYQVGNAWDIPNNSVRNVMSSAIIPTIPVQIHYIQYHQEFDLDVFYPIFNQPYKKVTSFVNCFSIADYMNNDWLLFQQVESLMAEWNFECLGGQCRDGAAHGNNEVAEKMRQSRFIWHTKYGGDGYGHIIYNSAAVCRPLIVKKEYYHGKMGEELMIDGETCIAIDGLSPQDIVTKIQHYNVLENYTRMCQNIYVNFKKHVDFEKETERIKVFLTNLR